MAAPNKCITASLRDENGIPYGLIAGRTTWLTSRRIKSRKLRRWPIAKRLVSLVPCAEFCDGLCGIRWHKARSRPWKLMHYSRWEIAKAGTAEVMMNEKRRVPPASNNSLDKNNGCIISSRDQFQPYSYNLKIMAVLFKDINWFHAVTFNKL